MNSPVAIDLDPAEIRRRNDGLLDRALRCQPYPSPAGLWCNVQLH
jgi:hypothetical protein